MGALALFFGFLIAGMPIFLVLGLTAMILFALGGRPMIAIPQKMLDDLNGFSLMAVPFFVMAATLMQKGGIARALIDAANAWIGGVRGGLAVVCVVATTGFAAICGSSVATAMAMGTVLVPAMLDRRYQRPFALGVVGASGTLGIIIPPSLSMIVYAIIAEESVPRLFLAGVIPGLLQAALFLLYVAYHVHRHDYPREPAPSRREFWRANGRAVPALLVPGIVLGGIYGGIVTVTEAAALSAVAALAVSLFFYREIKPSAMVGVLAQAMHSAATIMLIIATALVFGHWITESGAPARLVAWINGQGLSSWHFLLIINLILLVLGMFLEVVSIMLITLPLIVPVLKPLGIDPVHFGVVMTINMELGLITPPVGLNLYVLSSIARAPIDEVVRGIVPFIGLLLLLLGLVTYVPELSLWLPNALIGIRR
ncbi:MAG: TRAP transporter large permease [Rhodospirillales bacterium]|nr:TRAP transporter large permease [Rhodospirillales bacterium]